MQHVRSMNKLKVSEDWGRTKFEIREEFASELREAYVLGSNNRYKAAQGEHVPAVSYGGGECGNLLHRQYNAGWASAADVSATGVVGGARVRGGNTHRIVRAMIYFVYECVDEKSLMELSVPVLGAAAKDGLEVFRLAGTLTLVVAKGSSDDEGSGIVFDEIITWANTPPLDPEWSYPLWSTLSGTYDSSVQSEWLQRAGHAYGMGSFAAWARLRSNLWPSVEDLDLWFLARSTALA